MTGPTTTTTRGARGAPLPHSEIGDKGRDHPDTSPLPSQPDRLAALKPMLKLWPLSAVDPTTPKARPPGQDRNPFDDPAVSLPTASTPGATTPTGVAPSGSGSGANTSHGTSSSFQQHRLLHLTRPLSPSTPNTGHSNTGALSHDHTTAGPSTPRTVAPTTHVSIHDPVFNMQPPPAGRKNLLLSSNLKSSHSTGSDKSSSSPPSAAPSAPPSAVPSSSSTRGQLHLKLISAHSLNVSSHNSRPYVVVQYGGNEFISREPIAEFEKEVRGSATRSSFPSAPGLMSRNPSTSAISTLASISNGAAKKAGHPKSTGVHSSSSSVGSSSMATNVQPTNTASNPSGLFGSISPYNPVWKHEVSFDVTNDTSTIVLDIYDRACDETTPSSGFLGTLEIKPVLVHDHSVDEWYTLKSHASEKVTGTIRVQTTYEQYKVHRSLTPRDFEFLKLIGKGTFGRVFQVRKKDTKRIYAMKVLSKREIVAKKEVAHTIGERKILQKSQNSPFLVGLKFSFQTDTDLYLVTDFKSGGELFWHLQKDTRFSEERARFYIAELILALEHLHKYDIVYRDLKPENILLDATGHIALCDFGLSKPDLPSDQLTNTFCGTTEYLAPEVLLDDHGYSKLVDFWSLGVLLFEMCCGWSPFYADDTQQMYKNICFGKIKFPRNVINDDGKNFVKGLLNRNPKHRLGAQRDTEELKEHPFFKGIDWKALALKQVTPPFIPDVESDESVANFDPEFTGMSMADLDLLEDSDFDESDLSGAWVESASLSSSGFHAPNGPLGSDLAMSNVHLSGTKTPIEIKKKGKPPKENPLSSSIQDNFKGFSFMGESVANNGFFGAMSRERQLDLEDDESHRDGYYEEDGRYGRRGRIATEMDMD